MKVLETLLSESTIEEHLLLPKADGKVIETLNTDASIGDKIEKAADDNHKIISINTDKNSNDAGHKRGVVFSSVEFCASKLKGRKIRLQMHE